jgi:mono/diheme cytochrome c family protein/cbb3-type cytochrome oxidase cytochrome c subunit
MAATDQNYRNQKGLDIVFAVSCILMLLSIVALFAQDYYRDWKRVQRQFRDADEAVTERALLAQIEDKDLQEAEETDQHVAEARKAVDDAWKQHVAAIKRAQAVREKKSETAAGVKADYDSVVSLYDIAVEQRDESDPASRSNREAEVQDKYRRVQDLKAKLDEANRQLDEAEDVLLQARKPVKEAEDDLARKEDHLKKVIGKIDTVAKAVAKKKWKTGDWIRSLPVIDGFASPLKIQQVTLEEYPIDYSFRWVTRYDRCTTCHLGMEQDKFSKEALSKLSENEGADPAKEKLKRLHALYVKRQENGEGLGFDPGDLPRSLQTVDLTRAQVNQFCVHPRLDLFVDANSPHPKEKFGCTSCHAGQGSATDFDNATHVPSTYLQRQEWIKEHDWEKTHYGDWEYPMLPKRFIESTCLKCHHQVTDLIRYGSRDEAPKVVRGYNIIRELGCFGCHEIAGTKRGQPVGPDLRLEPSLPLEAMDAADREKLIADFQNPPGTMRKVGPSLYRLSEKTNPDWVRRWLNDPRGFRPTTRMPHFYNLSNNSPDVLPDEQKAFPAAEIDSIAHYLLEESQRYLKGDDIYRRTLKARQKELEEKQNKGESLTDPEKQEIQDLARNLKYSAAPVIQLMTEPVPLDKKLIDGEGKEVHLPDPVTDPKARLQHVAEGGVLFRERGCLACHQHQGTSKSLQVVKPELNNLQVTVPAVNSSASFGPDLSRLAAKLGPDKGDPQAKRRWLVQWILNPMVSFPRTRMPITHLDVNQAAAVADWLLSEESQGLGEWPQVPPADMKVLRELARVYVIKAPSVTRKEADEILNLTDESDFTIRGFALDRQIKYDADERRLQNQLGKVSADDLKWYIGKKAISRYGCFGCHDIPGFETAKPVGTPLNDWGKKDPHRLAFEDIVAYVQHGHKNKHSEEKGFQLVDSIEDEKGFGHAAEGQDVYERYFFLALEHQEREGFLYEKLTEPRSYDYHRMRTWDDRLKMPQFKFNHEKVIPKEGENPEQAANHEEMEARDAVMTFVLGLVAEPTPAKYLPSPSADRLAEIKGRKVLDKFNCAGCHQIRSGVYQFKDTDRLKDRLEKAYDSAKNSLLPDHVFPTHNAWVGQRPTGGRILAFGVAPKEEEPEEGQPLFSIRLTQALQFLTKENGRETAQNIPASSIPTLPEKDLLSRSDPWGGAFTDLLVPYLYGLNSVAYPIVGSVNDPRHDDKEVRSALPPSLIREGEKVQPTWLHQFLRDPTVIRPRAVLRMPKFNFSDAEILALVDYFAAADRLENPASSVTNLYLARQHLSPQVLHDQGGKYAAKLGPAKLKERADKLKGLWEEIVKYQELPDAQRRLNDAKQVLDAAKEAEKKETDAAKKKSAEAAVQKAQKDYDEAEKQAKSLEGQLQSKDFAGLRKQWEAGEVYATDAFRMMAQGGDKGSCLKCHQMGNLMPDDNKAPRLDLAAQRLRPEWTLHWVSNPERLLPYPSPMPAYFPKKYMGNEEVIKGQEYRNFFEGDSLEDIEALRNILMNFQEVVALPGNRFYRPGK